MFDEKSLFIQRMETKNSPLLLRYNSKLSFEPVAVSAKESFPPVWRVLGSGHTDGHWFDWVTDIICGVIFSLTVSHSIRDFRNSYVSSVCVSFYYYWKLTEHSLSIWSGTKRNPFYDIHRWILNTRERDEMRIGWFHGYTCTNLFFIEGAFMM